MYGLSNAQQTAGSRSPPPRSLFAMADPAALTQQELVDYLVTAVEETDVLYVVYWLQEMRRRGLLDSNLDPAAKGINLDRESALS